MSVGMDTRVTAIEAGHLLGLSPSTVGTWHERGLLPTVGRGSGRGRPNLYRWGDVLSAERTTRRRDPARRRSRVLAERARREAE